MLPQPPHNIILFELDFNVKFPSQFPSDLKSTICIHVMVILVAKGFLQSKFFLFLGQRS